MMAFSWFTGNTLEASSDRPLVLRARSLSDEASRVFPVDHSMPSSNYNIVHENIKGFICLNIFSNRLPWILLALKVKHTKWRPNSSFNYKTFTRSCIKVKNRLWQSTYSVQDTKHLCDAIFSWKNQPFSTEFFSINRCIDAFAIW